MTWDLYHTPDLGIHGGICKINMETKTAWFKVIGLSSLNKKETFIFGEGEQWWPIHSKDRDMNSKRLIASGRLMEGL